MKPLGLATCLLVLTLGAHGASAGTVLIKAAEAALPPAAEGPSIALVTRGITRKPDIVLTAPEASVSSPFNLKFKFAAHGGATIKPDSFHLIYLKQPDVDLTSRVKPFVTADGLDMTGAEAPPGKHTIKAIVSDSAGRKSSFTFVLNVLK